MSNVLPLRPRTRPDDPFSFDAKGIAFDWTNAEWVDLNLAHIRMAVAVCNRDSDQMAEAVGGLLAAEGDLAARWLEDIKEVREQLEAIVGIMTCAEARWELTLERLGAPSPVLA